MKTLLMLVVATIVLGVPAGAHAGSLTCQGPVKTVNATPPTANPGSRGSYRGSANQSLLDRRDVTIWTIDNVVIPKGETITGATLTFTNAANWNGDTNILFVHMFDSDVRSGIHPLADPGLPGPSILDSVATANIAGARSLVDGSENIFLGQHSFSKTSDQTWTLTFSQDQLNALAAYIANGNNLAFGVQTNCGFWKNGYQFTIETTNGAVVVPEPTTLALLGSGLFGLYLRRRNKRKAV